jgi:hypothetical protein
MKHNFPFGRKKGDHTEHESENTETQTAQKQAERLERIRASVNELNKTGEMPETIRGMAQAIAKSAKVSVETLYENKQLWHPEFTETSNSPNTNNSAPFPTAIAAAVEQAETQTERTVTEKALYKALGCPETPLRGQELPKFANVDFQVLTDLPKSPQKTSDPMWIETHGRLSPPKAEISKVAISQNRSPKTANADCLRPYEPPKSEPISAIGSRIGYLKALLETPILRRSKSASEIASLQAELERLECDRQTYSSS